MNKLKKCILICLGIMLSLQCYGGKVMITTYNAVVPECISCVIEKLKEIFGDVTTGDGKYNFKTSNALKYAETKGDKKGKCEKDKEKIRKETIYNGIAFEKRRLMQLDKRISENARKQNELVRPDEGKKLNLANKSHRDILDYLRKEQSILIHKRKLTMQRIKKYQETLTTNPYKKSFKKR